MFLKLSQFSVTTAWRVLTLRIKERSCSGPVAGQPEFDSRAAITRYHSVCNIYVDDRKELL